MKKYVSLFFILLLTCCTITTKSSKDVKIISYNIRTLSDDGENSWQFRREATKNMLERHSPDAFGLQEARLPHMQYIDSVCPQYARVGVARDDGKERGEFMAIYYKKERFELLDSGTFWLSETPDKVSRGWDAAYNRITTWVKLRDKSTGKEFFYFNTHFDHRGRVAQTESAKLIVKKIKEIAGDKYPIFLTGDFNVEVDNEILRPLFDSMNYARTTAPISDNKGSYNAYGKVDRDIIIDHIFYSDCGAVCNEFRTLDGDYGAKFISDHYPVEAVFTLR